MNDKICPVCSKPYHYISRYTYSKIVSEVYIHNIIRYKGTHLDWEEHSGCQVDTQKTEEEDEENGCGCWVHQQSRRDK